MEPEKKTNGAFVGLVIIIVILVLGGIYVFMSKQDSVPPALEENLSAEASSVL